MSPDPAAQHLFPAYRGDQRALHRLWNRWQIVCEPIKLELAGKSILDIGAHDGRWSYAFARSGADAVVAVEPRSDLVEEFASYPDDQYRQCVQFECTDVFNYLQRATSENKRFDVVALLGILYHTLDHLRMLRLIQQLHPRLIIIDSEFVSTRNSIVQLTRERTDNPLNAVPNFYGDERTAVGIPSTGAMELYADMIDCDITWIDPLATKLQGRVGVRDYFRETRKRRQVCMLRLRGR